MNFIKPHPPLWKKPAFLITTGVDTEYVQKPEYPNQMITTQIAFSSNEEDCIVLEHPELKLGILPTWKTTAILSHILDFEEDFNEELEPDNYLIWEVLMFFAPADLLAGLFNNKMLCKYIQRHCRQDARIRIDNGSGKKFDNTKHLLKLPIFLTSEEYGRSQITLNVSDLGKIGVGGLKNVAQSLGIPMENKNLMDDYKSKMDLAYKDLILREAFIRYAKSDACILFEMRERNNERSIALYETLDLNPPAKEKLTTGSIVAGLFYEWIKNILQEQDPLFGDVEPGYTYFTKKNGKSYNLADLLKKGGVSYFANTNVEFTKQTNALIQGGRAKNERPTVINDNGVIADADLSSCYATILENLIYPVGIPFTYSKHESSNEVITLGDFLKKHEKNLVPRLYTIIVSGKLNHQQTLVPSKIVDNFKINEKYSEDDPKIDAEFRLYTREIINGVITSDVIDVLRNVCNRNELASWMKLEVVSATYYPESKNAFEPAMWSAAIKRHKQEKGNNVIVEQKPCGKEIVTDKRSKHWVGLPIKEFIKPFKDKRRALKEKRNQNPQDSSEWKELDAQQNSMKLVCNTLYGVLASPYFDIGNVVVANNITAAARCAVWCLATAAGTYQSITDGGAYNLNQVRDWTGTTKPCMNTLSLWRNTELIHRRYKSKLITKPLGSDTLWGIGASDLGNEYSVLKNQDYLEFEAKAEGWNYLDEELLKHIKHFFRKADGSPANIDVLNQITFSHKDIYESIVLHSQTNYQFIHVSGDRKTKARGHKLDGKRYDNETKPSNILDLFENLRENPNNIPAYPKQTRSQVLKCDEANRMLMARKSNIVQQAGLLAGDSILKTSWVRPISLSMFHWKTHEQYKSWENKADRIKDNHGYGIEQWFLDEEMRVDYERAIDTIQSKIDADEFWIVGNRKQSGNKTKKYRNHPYKE